MSAAKPPTVLTIAGSDPSGGAGIEADLKVITAHGCYGMTTITGLTAQNTLGVRDIFVIPAEFVKKSLDAVFEDMPVDVVKTGMLTSAATIEVVADAMKQWKVEKLVLDPVLISTSGAHLVPSDALEMLREVLLPMAFIVTPNLAEAQVLAGITEFREVVTVADLKSLASLIGTLGPKYVLVKGGHSPLMKDGTLPPPGKTPEIVVDVLFDPKTHKFEIFEKPYVDSTSTHGTGCSLAAAIASNLAKGQGISDAIREAGQYISWAIETAPGFGSGKGPLNHLHSNYMVPFAPGHFLDYLKGHPKVQKVWEGYTRHEFIKRLGAGTLTEDQFAYYLRQDYLFLTQFARAHSLAGSKANRMEDTLAAAKIVQHIYEESRLHINYCEGFGISKEDIEATEEDIACTAYTRYVLDIGNSHDVLALHVALAPCLFGYHEIGAWLLADANTKHHDNPYYKWILVYGQSESYLNAVREGRAFLERKARAAGPDRLEELVDIFAHATKMEKGFWTMGLEGPARRLGTSE
ncbi:thiamine biosynthesis protein Thi-4 [Tricharina praecox]|uniref:thiamine biosynthesis protein Thi-4 n=1 Tax=Tricharina praecox TaxID=43433 RepID=UPI00221E4C0D|nr:thiamine biosynthesis protein Thi-4 [Tricharina praecox]KAI5858837.1 thiamine biosynthesis protein Thi-4 [Tricharina praecox]